MDIIEFLKDPGSTTGYFRELSTDYKLEILHHGINGDTFQRTIAIYLDNIPVMLAISSTNIQNPLFLDILENAGIVPIGTRLFAPNANIVRKDLQVIAITVSAVKNKIITTFLNSMQNKPDTLYYRSSNFVYQDEEMHLDEYALPELVDLLLKVKKI